MQHANFSADAWLRGLLVKAWEDLYQVQKDPANVKVVLKGFVEDSAKVMGQLAQSEFMASSCSEVLNDMRALDTLMCGATETPAVRASDVSKALEHVKSKKLGALYQAICKSAIGKTVIAAATTMMQLSAKDQTADDKLGLATAVLKDGRLPKLQLTAGGDSATADAVISNFGLVCDGSVVEVLDESLNHMAESLELWSPMRMQDKIDEIATWVPLLINSAAFYSECSCLYLHALAESCHVSKLFGGGGGTFGDDANGGDAPIGASFAEVSAVVEENMHDEDAMVEFVGRLTSFIRHKLPAEVKAQVGVEDSISMLEDKVLRNSKSRSQAAVVLMTLADMQDLPRCASEALDEWKTKHSLGKEASSFLAKSISLDYAVKELAALPVAVGDWYTEEDILLQLDEGEGLQGLTSSCSKAAALHPALLTCPAVLQSGKLVVEVVQIAVDDFADALFLDSIAMPSPISGLATVQNVCSIFDTFYKKNNSPEMVKLATKVFSSSTRGGQSWPAEGLHSLVVRLLDMLPDDTFSIATERFCVPDSNPGEWNSKDRCKAVLEVLLKMSQVAVSCAWLRARVSNSEGMVKQGGCKLKDDAELALNFMRSTANQMAEKLEQGLLYGAVVEGMPCRAPIGSAKDWFQCARGLMPLVCKVVLVKLVGSVAALSVEVAKCTPKVDHIVGTDSFNSKLARSSLLGWPSRKQLNDKAILLFHGIADCGRLHAQWALSPDLETDEDVNADFKSARSVFTSARQAMMAIAAANILLELSGEERAAKAEDLLNRKRAELPEILIKELEKAKKTKQHTAEVIVTKSE